MKYPNTANRLQQVVASTDSQPLLEHQDDLSKRVPSNGSVKLDLCQSEDIHLNGRDMMVDIESHVRGHDAWQKKSSHTSTASFRDDESLGPWSGTAQQRDGNWGTGEQGQNEEQKAKETGGWV